jgi:NADH-quinone oxidoreductase subunit C
MSDSQLEKLSSSLQNILTEQLVSITEQFGQLTIVIRSKDVQEVSRVLRDHGELDFDSLIDLCGMDYSTYGANGDAEINQEESQSKAGARFAAVYHLLSIKNNQRLRVKAFAEDNELPLIDSVVDIWPGVNWFEREAFDLFGIIFSGHPDLRRILTDYGFIGNPFRKDFPITGYVEMRYDADQKRVIYQPVSIEPREITPHVIREARYGEDS